MTLTDEQLIAVRALLAALDDMGDKGKERMIHHLYEQGIEDPEAAIESLEAAAYIGDC